MPFGSPSLFSGQMSAVTLVHPSESRQIQGLHLVTKCTLFRLNLALLAQPYSIQSDVTVANFRDFAGALQDAPITITSQNFCELAQLAHEVGFEDLERRVTEFRESSNTTIPTAELLNAIARMSHLERQRTADAAQIAALTRRVEELSRALETQGRGLTQMIEDLTAAVTTLREENAALRASPRPAPTPTPPVPQLDSLIVTEFPTEILRDFVSKRFALLWRASRDGFHMGQFHSRCDGRSNTLVLVMDVGGNIFGGFTPVAWDSNGNYKNDTSNRSFVFTLKNPSGLGPMKFSLANTTNAIYGDANWAAFGHNFDIGIYTNSDSNTASYTNLGGKGYMNHTGRDGKTVFTGSYNFRSREIEVFEITG
jgi:hypothetical protein